jgi:hypothetical protein
MAPLCGDYNAIAGELHIEGEVRLLDAAYVSR